MTPPATPLPRRVRELFAGRLEASLEPLASALGSRLLELADQAPSTREAHERRDALLAFDRQRGSWQARTAALLRGACASSGSRGDLPAQRPPNEPLSLLPDEVVEREIIASRLAMAIHEKASFELNDLRLRMKHLEGVAQLSADDILLPERIARLLVEGWRASELPRTSWLLLVELIHSQVAATVAEAYAAINQALVKAGVMPEIRLAGRVQGAAPTRAPGPVGGGAHDAPQGAARLQGRRAPAAGAGAGAGNGNGNGNGNAGWPGGPGGAPEGSGPPQGPAFGGSAMGPGAALWRGAQGVAGQLRRLLTDRVAGFDPGRPVEASASLGAALLRHSTHAATLLQPRAHGAQDAAGDARQDVQEAAQALRERSTELKRQATTPSEKALIEVVALMFQHILAEERLPPSVRIWFARLQMPVLRVALAEPEFFGSLQHPARQLIDRMGGCVLGFDAAAISGSALEAEIRRVVQLIEQYPESGRKAFALAYEEFQQFLSHFLTERQATQRLVTVAQQVEQKETMTVRYTIELRSMLDGVPVREEIREFLFKVWAEVLAVSAVRDGPQHVDTLALKKSAADLVWASCAKPNRAERAEVIASLPELLQRLRRGMSIMGLQGPEQERHIKAIGDTLADAFQAKTPAIPRERVEALAERLANLEDFIDEDHQADLPLDAESIELMLGLDAKEIAVITDGGASRPGAAAQAWATELQPGSWFQLDHNGQVHPVQYVWRSPRRQLHLFAETSGMSFLIQVGRLAAYLQAGLLAPAEEEALTVRATRGALARLDANPERLLG